MARLAGFPEDAFFATQRIRDTALVHFDSLFTPDRKVWTLQNFRRFHALFVERFDLGEGSFLEKWKKQLEGADDHVLQLAAELLYVQQFFTSLAGPEKKLENVKAVLSWCAHAISIPEWAVLGVKRGLAGDQSFNQHRPFHLAWLIQFMIHWHELPETERQELLGDPWRFAENVRSVWFSEGAHQPMREAWLYIVFPDRFENISSRRDKRLIRDAFKGRLQKGPTHNIDADLLEIRQQLATEQGEGFNFYRPPIIEQWKKKAKAPEGPGIPGHGPPGTPAGDATRGVKAVRLRSDDSKREIVRAQRLFGAVARVHFSRTNVPTVLFTRLNRQYQPAITLATLVLRSLSVDFGQGAARGSALLIDMNHVFETFVRSALRMALELDVKRFPERAPSLRLDEGGAVPLRPDLCWVEDQRIIWIGDAKYKRLPFGTYKNADLYQPLAYAIATRLPNGTLIYAADEGVSAAEHVVTQAGKRLHVFALDLFASRAGIRRQIGALAEKMRTSRAQEIRTPLETGILSDIAGGGAPVGSSQAKGT